MNYTNVEQATYLLSLGLDKNTADMWYDWQRHIRAEKRDKDYCWAWIPSWSTDALLETARGTINLCKDGTYWCEWSDINSDTIDFTTSEYCTPFEACYEMIVWLLENGYIK